MRLATYLAVAVSLASAGCESSQNTIIGLGGSGGSGATHLTFTAQPTATGAGLTLATVQVAAQNASGSADTTYVNAVTVSIGANPAAGVLSGHVVVTPVRGVASFTDLSIDRAGSGYTLTATAPQLTSAASASFTITP